MSINDGASSEIGSLQDRLHCVEIVRDDFKARWEASIKDCLSLRARLEKAERVVEAARETRDLLLKNWSDNLNWRKGQEHTYLGQMDILLESALAALDAQGEASQPGPDVVR
ncbi:hypothetical protein [Glutamicibacter sp.]|jgi:hypothetical protein|uniref:hypothetical protein n=1 Tax=Glutamicibacter sp. TaxID=1931995 RepID=UPI002FDB5C90